MPAPRRERRQRERHSSQLYLQFVDYRTGDVVGDLADVSAGGFKLESTRPILLGREFVFRVDVPAEISSRPFIKLIARSLWSAPDPMDSRLYDTGFEILGIDSVDVRTWDTILERYAQRRNNQESWMHDRLRK